MDCGLRDVLGAAIGQGWPYAKIALLNGIAHYWREFTVNKAIFRTLAFALLLGAPLGAQAVEKLTFAHAYETSEAFHKWAVWAADQVKARTDGRYEIDVFPASQLGSQQEMAEGIDLGEGQLFYCLRSKRSSEQQRKS